MRVIAGEFKGTQLLIPKRNVRPTTDRVKESMFHLMGINPGELPVVDLFAGSGALGIEAISRGVSCVILVDKSPDSVKAVRSNLQRCRVSEASAEVWRLDWHQAVVRLAERFAKLGWVFVDPPYHQNLWIPVLEAVQRYGVVIEHGIICEHPKHIPLPVNVGDFEAYKDRAYGDIQLTLYRTSRTRDDET